METRELDQERDMVESLELFSLDEESHPSCDLSMKKTNSIESQETDGSSTLDNFPYHQHIKEEEQVSIDIHNYTASEQEQKLGLKDFELLSVIGKGAYGKVFLVKKKTGSDQEKASEYYAMKVLKKASIILHGKGDENERNILKKIQHPFIVKLHYAFQTMDKLYLILTYAPGGELFSYLAKERMFTEDVARFYISEILCTLEHLHNLGIIYRDLKPENVLLAADGHICLTDFGLSKVALSTSTVCGTPEFTAPEIFDERGVYDKAVDFWSLGVMLFDMLTGSPPFTGHNRRKIMESVLKKKPKFPKYMTAQAQDLCNKLLKKNPSMRLGSMGAETVKKHIFFHKINWTKLESREMTPPFIPTLHHAEDLSHFNQEFTKMPMESPPHQSEEELLALHSDYFKGFSFVASGRFPMEETDTN